MSEMNQSGMTPSVQGVVRETQAAMEGIPDAEIRHAHDRLGKAAEVMAGVGVVDHPQLQETYSHVHDAVRNIGTAASRISLAAEGLGDYLQHLTGSAGSKQTEQHIPGGVPEAILYDPAEEQGNGKFIIAERILGDTTFRVSLNKHRKENAAEVAAALQGCDVIAIECVGFESQDYRERVEQIVTRLLNSGNSELAVSYMQDELTPFSAAVLEKFIGTGIQVKLLDIDLDHPDYALTLKYEEAVNATLDAVYGLAPIEVLRHDVVAEIAADKAAIEARDAASRKQLADIARQHSGAKVGVAVGTMHHGVLDGLQSPSGETKEDLKVRLRSMAHGSNIALLAPQGMTQEEIVDRTLFAQYVSACSRGMTAVDPHELAERVGPKVVSNTLRNLGEMLARPKEPHEKAKDIKVYLSAVIALAQKYSRIKPGA